MASGRKKLFLCNLSIGLMVFFCLGDDDGWHRARPRNNLPDAGGRLLGRLRDRQLGLVLVQPHPHHRVHARLLRHGLQGPAVRGSGVERHLRPHHDGGAGWNLASGIAVTFLAWYP